MDLEAEVIVIGAGISGLKAANDLHNRNVSTLILEARPRIGGRIFTNHDYENHYDLGASWFHATMENSIFDSYLNEWGYSSNDIYYDDNKIDIIVGDTDNGHLPENCNISPIIEELKVFANNLPKDTSVKNVVCEYLSLKKNLLNENQIKYAPCLYRFAELMGGCRWDMISAKLAYAPFQGRDAFNRLGYDKILEKTIDNYPIDKINLNSIVKSIEKIKIGDDDETIVKITTTSGQSFKSKYALVTIPLSVLKLSVDEPSAIGAITFQPELPAVITENFKKTHFTTLSKIIVEFDTAFWPDTEKFLVLSNSEENETYIDKSFPIKEFDDWTDSEEVKAFNFPCLVENLNAVRNVPALMFLLPAQPSKQLESSENPKEYGFNLIKPILAKISGKPINEIAKPKIILTTNWGTDPFSRGAISANAVGDILVNDPILDGFGNIRFAGEAYTYAGHGCAHGAFQSGAKEADYIATRLNK